MSILSFLRCVTASVSASASMTQQLLSGRVARPKPFRVTNADRSVKKGIMAETLEDLMNKVRRGCGVLKGLRRNWHVVEVDDDQTLTQTVENIKTKYIVRKHHGVFKGINIGLK